VITGRQSQGTRVKSRGRGQMFFRHSQDKDTTNMSQGGDSGSLVLDMKARAVGLLFAGSEQVTILNPISEVLKILNIELYS